MGRANIRDFGLYGHLLMGQDGFEAKLTRNCGSDGVSIYLNDCIALNRRALMPQGPPDTFVDCPLFGA